MTCSCDTLIKYRSSPERIRGYRRLRASQVPASKPPGRALLRSNVTLRGLVRLRSGWLRSLSGGSGSTKNAGHRQFECSWRNAKTMCQREPAMPAKIAITTKITFSISISYGCILIKIRGKLEKTTVGICNFLLFMHGQRSYGIRENNGRNLHFSTI